MYLTEEDIAEERDGGAGTARGSTTLGRPIIVGVDRKTGGVHAHKVKCKGSGDPWIATRVAADIEELGSGGSRVVLKADQDVAIADEQRQVVASKKGATVPVNSPVGESQSNGRVENAVQRVQVLIRTLKDALERRLNARIRSSDAIFPWMVEWAAGLITRYVKGHKGRTAYRGARGHDAQALVAEFGEKIMYMPSKNTSKSAPRVDAKFHYGVWLGLRMKSDESIIGTPNGVIKAKTVRRLLEDQRWCAEEVLSTRGIP